MDECGGEYDDLVAAHKKEKTPKKRKLLAEMRVCSSKILRAARAEAAAPAEAGGGGPSGGGNPNDLAMERIEWADIQDLPKYKHVSEALPGMLQSPFLVEEFLLCSEDNRPRVQVTLQKARGRAFLVLQRIRTDPDCRNEGWATYAIRQIMQVGESAGWGVIVQSVLSNIVKHICTKLAFVPREHVQSDMIWTAPAEIRLRQTESVGFSAMEISRRHDGYQVKTWHFLQEGQELVLDEQFRLRISGAQPDSACHYFATQSSGDDLTSQLSRVGAVAGYRVLDES